MNKQARPARRLLASLVMAALGLPLGSAVAGSAVAYGFGDLSLATLVPNTRVVVDPDLETPALVSFEEVGGLPVSGADAETLGRAAFFHPMVSKMYGTLNPKEHLQFLSAHVDHRGDQRIAFEQREKGVRVEGAYVTVTVSPKNRAREIHGRFLYFPQVDWRAVKSSGDLEDQALAAYQKTVCGEMADCWLPADRDGRKSGVSAELVVLSSRLMQGTSLPPLTERLAWRYVYPLADIYVDASGKGGVLLTIDKLRDAIPHDVYDKPTLSLQVTTDPTRTAAPFPDAEAFRAHILIDQVDGFYNDHGRNGYDGSGGVLEAWVNWEVPNAAFWANDGSITEHPWLKGMPAYPAGIFFGQDYLGNDVVAHELTHGVTTFTAGLVYAGESGALNESYSDVIANLIYPDNVRGQWLVGEDTKRGAIRDMANPSQSPFPGIRWQPDHVMNLPYACLADRDQCVHTWSGVPNLAAVLIAQGGLVPASGAQVAQGIGPEKLAVLYFQTLTGMRLGPASNFMSQRLATLSECESLVESGYTARGSQPFTAQDCAVVAEAFDAVGVEAKPRYGWMRFQNGLGSNGADVSFLAGERLFNGCTVADQRLALWADHGPVSASTLATGLNVDMGGWGGWVSARGAATDPADRSANVHLWADWSVENPSVSFTDTIAVTPGLTYAQCLAPLPPAGSPPVHVRSLYSAQRVSHWASFFDGGRYDETVNAGVRLPAGCSVLSVRGLPMVRTAPVGTAVPSMDFGDHGFTVSAGQPGDPAALDAFVHSWHDGLSAVALRVAYDVVEPDGTDCLVPGALQDTP